MRTSIFMLTCWGLVGSWVFAAAADAHDGSPQRTLALIKPDAYDKGPAILVDIADLGFSIVEVADLHLSPLTAGQFYEEHSQRPFFDDLIEFVSSGRILAAVLEKQDAIVAWREAIGPTDADVARTVDPASLRAKYGTDKTRNALHGSDSEASAVREIGFFFPHLKASSGSTPHAADMEEVDPTRADMEGEGGGESDVLAAEDLEDGPALENTQWKGLTQQEVIETVTRIAKEKGESINDVVRQLNEMWRRKSDHTEL
mmetsp:Transcript_9549/g.24225  ORF Transcript_9549/g.24225 Transcript_9549/m.24225 type:complete len:258 (-) Transcript_9549:229-1002(-)